MPGQVQDPHKPFVHEPHRASKAVKHHGFSQKNVVYATADDGHLNRAENPVRNVKSSPTFRVALIEQVL